MSEESSRSTRPSGQRHSTGVPTWWASLDRGDLPADGGVQTTPAQWLDDDAAETPLRQMAGAEGMPSRRRAWLINLAVVIVAALVIMLGVGVDSPTKAMVVGLVFGVPLVLAAVTVAIAARRAR
jgi:hypothetical protein